MGSHNNLDPTDTGIYAKINPKKSPVLYRPQPVTYCKHCGSGHVTTMVPVVQEPVPEPVPSVEACTH